MIRRRFYACMALTFLGAAGCVSSAKYNTALEDAERARSAQLRAGWESNRERGSIQASLDQCQHASEDLSARLQTSESALSEAKIEAHNLQARLDEATAIDEKLRDELQRFGKNVDQLLADRGAMSHALDDAKARLEELRRAQAAEEAKAALYAQLVREFKKLTDAGQLKVIVRDGRMMLELPGDVLFDSGQAVLGPGGQRTLDQIAAVLKTLGGRKFQVAGHTDNVRIDSRRFASNWDLSAARALSVVRHLTARGVPPATLSAAGYGEFDPVASNDAADGRAKNRRIEISLMPDMKSLAMLPGGS